MKISLAVILATITLSTSCQTIHKSENVITSDITNFWRAYDKITSTEDSILQYQYLDSLYFQNGTNGLEGIRAARNYTPEDYIYSINHYPKFWKSIRNNTLELSKTSSELEVGIQQLKNLYLDLKPAKIYFTIGAFRTGGTTIDSMVMIGSEISLTDSTTETSEFPENLSHLKSHFKTNPKDHLVFLNVHEYVHTQQNSRVFNLISLVIYEGVAEFVAEKSLGVSSPNPQIEFGKANAERIRAVFEEEMFYTGNMYKWLDGNAPNEFGMRDLGYYVGYQICENYYNQAENKKEAIKKLIELDYTDEKEMEEIIKASGYFSTSLEDLYQNFESKRPTVIGLKPFENNSQNVDVNTNQITIVFSEPVNQEFRNFDYGPLGESSTIQIKEIIAYSQDGKTLTFEIHPLEPNKQYQLLIGWGFRNLKNIPIKEYLINFKTTAE